jgi:hypothetical protein
MRSVNLSEPAELPTPAAGFPEIFTLPPLCDVPVVVLVCYSHTMKKLDTLLRAAWFDT